MGNQGASGSGQFRVQPSQYFINKSIHDSNVSYVKELSEEGETFKRQSGLINHNINMRKRKNKLEHAINKPYVNKSVFINTKMFKRPMTSTKIRLQMIENQRNQQFIDDVKAGSPTIKKKRVKSGYLLKDQDIDVKFDSFFEKSLTKMYIDKEPISIKIMSVAPTPLRFDKSNSDLVADGDAKIQFIYN